MNWIHVKTGTSYQIVAHAIEEATMRPVIVYCESRAPSKVWVRPAEEFFDGRFRQSMEPTRARVDFGPGNDPMLTYPEKGRPDLDPTVGRVGTGDMVLGGSKRDLTDPEQDPQVTRRNTMMVPPKK